MSDTFESERAPEPVGAFPHSKRVASYHLSPTRRCNQLDAELKETL